MDNRDKILAFVANKGPVLPVQITKEINMNILMSSAHLAELTDSKKLKISTIKVGGSPLYYLPGQEAMLEKYASNLNEKDKRAFDLLKEQKILKDTEQTPLMRVTLREIKDFAVPIYVTYDDSKEMFWKWHTASNEEVEKLIKIKLNFKEEKKEEKTKEAEKPKPAKIPKEKKPKKEKTDFMSDVLKFFEKNSVTVLNTEIIKKNSEIDFMIEIPTIMGSLQYYCKARNKKTINENDLSSAYIKAQFRKLPVILISAGELTQKAQDMLKNELKGLSFKKL